MIIDKISTTNVNENKGNWFDVLTVHDPNGELDANAGEAFHVRRNPVFDSRNPPTVFFDTRGEESSDWAVLPSSAFLAQWTEGIILIKQSWLDSLPAGSRPCFRLEGYRFVQNGSMKARQLNNLAKAVETLDDLWIRTGTGSDGTSSIAGILYPAYIRNIGFSCLGCTANSTGLMLGWNRESWIRWADALQWGGLSFPQPWKDTSTGAPGLCIVDESGSGAGSFTQGTVTAWTDCVVPGWCSGGYDRRAFGTESRLMYIWPWGGPPGHFGFPPNCFGTDASGLGADIPPSHGATIFRFQGVPFDVPHVLKRVPDGTQIISAQARVKFDGLAVRDWNYTLSNWYPRNSDSALSFPYWRHLSTDFYINGVRTRHYRGVDVTGGDPFDEWAPEPDPQTSLPVTFALAGKRLHSRNVFFALTFARNMVYVEDPTPEYIEAWRNFSKSTVEDGDWRFFGNSVSTSTVESGKWSLVNITGAIQGALTARNSEYRQLQLWPTIGGISPDNGYNSLKGYLLSNDAQSSITWSNVDDAYHSYTINFAGKFVSFDSMQISDIMIRFRLPSGAVEDVTVPINRPKMMIGNP